MIAILRKLLGGRDDRDRLIASYQRLLESQDKAVLAFGKRAEDVAGLHSQMVRICAKTVDDSKVRQSLLDVAAYIESQSELLEAEMVDLRRTLAKIK